MSRKRAFTFGKLIYGIMVFILILLFIKKCISSPERGQLCPWETVVPTYLERRTGKGNFPGILRNHG